MKQFINFMLIMTVAVIMASCGSTRKAMKKDYGEEIEVTVPNDPNKYPDTKEYFRYSAQYTSPDYNQARTVATNLCRGELAAKIKAAVKGGVSLYQNQITTQNEGEDRSDDLSSVSEMEYTTIVDETLEEVETLVDKVTRNSKTGKYTAYITLQVKKTGVADATTERLRGMRGSRAEFIEYLKNR